MPSRHAGWCERGGGASLPPISIVLSRSGGFSSFRRIELQVSATGRVDVAYETNGRIPEKHHYALNPPELLALSNTIVVSQFFDVSVERSSRNVDVPDSTLTVNLGGRSRTIQYGFFPKLALLDSTIHRLINQSVRMIGLEKRGEIRLVMEDVHPVRCQVYCPQLLEQPVKDFFNRCEERRKLEYALAALARLNTEGQWMGFITNHLKEAAPTRRLELLEMLSSHVFHYDVPKGHLAALLPYLTSVVASYASPGPKLEEPETRVLMQIIFFISRAKYREAQPVLERFVDSQPDINSRSRQAAESTLFGFRREAGATNVPASPRL